MEVKKKPLMTSLPFILVTMLLMSQPLIQRFSLRSSQFYCRQPSLGVEGGGPLLASRLCTWSLPRPPT